MTPVLLADIGQYFREMAPADGAAWVFVIIGFVGQIVFGMRFFVQWLASERAGHSYIPKVFWYLSIVGGMLLFTYACSRKDPIIMMGQSTNLLVYVRNLMLIRKKRRERELKTAAGTAFDIGLAAFGCERQGLIVLEVPDQPDILE